MVTTRLRFLVVVAASVAVFTGGVAAHASGGTSVSTKPASFTPRLASSDTQIDQIAQCGSTMYATGMFTKIAAAGGTTYSRGNAFSFSASTGVVSTWNPNVNGEVRAIAFSSNCGTAYLGGVFTKVGSSAVTNLAAVSTSTGAVVSSFRPQPDYEVFALAVTGPQLLVGGEFKTVGGGTRTALASVSPTTGALGSYVNLQISGNEGTESGMTRVFKLVVNPAGTRALVMGNFSSVGGSARRQAFVIDLGASTATLDAWYAPDLEKTCSAKESYYVRAGTWSTDGSRIYLATTGDKGASPLCDSASAFSSAATGKQSPLWINPTGCDSLYAVAADASSVYVGGHERFADNAHGCNKAGPGAVDRPGVGAISTSSGTAQAWNPTRSRGHGADDALRTSAGLWIASDDYLGADNCAGIYHPGLCFFPNG